MAPHAAAASWTSVPARCGPRHHSSLRRRRSTRTTSMTALIDALFGRDRRHVERARDGALLSFFHGDATSRRAAREGARGAAPARPTAAQRPAPDARRDRADLDRLDGRRVPFDGDEGHVGINRFLSTVRGYLGFDRSHGLRVFVEVDGAVAAARRAVGVRDDARCLPLDLPPCRRPHRGDERRAQRAACAGAGDRRARRRAAALPLALHVALGGDDGSDAGRGAHRTRRRCDRRHRAAGERRRAALPARSFRIVPAGSTRFERVGGDELLYRRPALARRAVRLPRHRAGAALRDCAARPPRRREPGRAGGRRRCGAARHPAALHAARRRDARNRCCSWPTCCRGCARTRWCTTCRRAGSSSTRAAAGARATSARDRSNCCSRSAISRRCATCCARDARAVARRRLAAVVHVLRARAHDPRRRLARRHRVLAAAGAGALPARVRRCGVPRRVAAVLRRQGRQRLAARRARARADRPSASSPAPRSPPTATATGTTRCSRPTRRCASACAARGP